MPNIPLNCPTCGAPSVVDSNQEVAICEYCGNPYAVKDTIIKTYINMVNQININADSVTLVHQKEFEIVGGVLKAYNGESVHVVIPNYVKEISPRVFYNLAIESIQIPESVEVIGCAAFLNCSRLEKVELRSKTAAIRSNCFQNCSSLQDIDLPDSLTTLEQDTFCGCVSLKSVKLPASLQYIEKSAFQDCNSLKTVKLPASLQNIGEAAFQGCISLETLDFPSSLKSIGVNAFSRCNSLKSVEFPASLEKLEGFAFRKCATLEKVVFAKMIELMPDSGCFEDCKKLSDVTFPALSTSVLSHEKWWHGHTFYDYLESYQGEYEEDWDDWHDYDSIDHHALFANTLFSERMKNEFLLEKQKQQRENYKKLGKCQHCGSDIGILSRRCKNPQCGRMKDY